jgi:hypothetical protein
LRSAASSWTNLPRNAKIPFDSFRRQNAPRRARAACVAGRPYAKGAQCRGVGMWFRRHQGMTQRRIAIGDLLSVDVARSAERLAYAPPLAQPLP